MLLTVIRRMQTFFSTNDIESIEVLKDAASAAITDRELQGVLFWITTKRGKEGRITG
jgi:hypothetical protein